MTDQDEQSNGFGIHPRRHVGERAEKSIMSFQYESIVECVGMHTKSLQSCRIPPLPYLALAHESYSSTFNNSNHLTHTNPLSTSTVANYTFLKYRGAASGGLGVGAAGTLRSPGLNFLPSLHTLQGTSFHMPPSPLLSYRWLEGTHLSALRDMPVFFD